MTHKPTQSTLLSHMRCVVSSVSRQVPLSPALRNKLVRNPQRKTLATWWKCVWCFNILHIRAMCGPGSSVGIVTDYGLDSSGSNPGGDEIFRPSRSALWPYGPMAHPVNIPVWCIVLRTVSISMTRMRGSLQLQLMALCHSQVTLMESTDTNITETTHSCQFQYEFGNQ